MLKKTLRNQKGFTLIEIIAVLVILGILAAVAVPKYMNMSTEARRATVNGLKGSVLAAASLTYGKAAVKGTSITTAGVTFTLDDGTTITLNYGYPTAASIGAVMQDISGFTNTNGVFTKDGATTPATCGATYAPPAANGGSPSVTFNDAGLTGC